MAHNHATTAEHLIIRMRSENQRHAFPDVLDSFIGN
jgi:hypothetical protein